MIKYYCDRCKEEIYPQIKTFSISYNDWNDIHYNANERKLTLCEPCKMAFFTFLNNNKETEQ